MSIKRSFRLALVGNPNSGKSSIFNQLTGLRQKVGNYPGITVDKKTGTIPFEEQGNTIEVLDLPGAYSLYSTSQDEQLIVKAFTAPAEKLPELIVYVADINHLEKQLLLFTQVRDLGIPMILALNMSDIATEKGIQCNVPKLTKQLKVPVIEVSARTNQGMETLVNEVKSQFSSTKPQSKASSSYRFSDQEKAVSQSISALLSLDNDYQALLYAHHYQWLSNIDEAQKEQITQINEKQEFQSLSFQVRETMQRYDRFTPIVQNVLSKPNITSSNTQKIDRLATHPFWGVLIFFGLIFLIFQAIFVWAAYPMDAISGGFTSLQDSVRSLEISPAWLSDLLTSGILEGFAGVLVFVPQIAILFFLISLLEESGYMARAVYLFDHSMRRFSLNGRSIVALISGGACAIPAVMSTRTISNWKERLITILVTPFISCSARIPVYLILIGFIIPPQQIWGIFNLQGIAFMGLYMLGIIAALGAAWIFKKILKTESPSYLLLELPEYRRPLWSNVGLTVWEKTKTFVWEAGKIILVISIALWFLVSYGPGDQMQTAEELAKTTAQSQQLDESATNNLVATKRIEASYAGHFGKFIEPAIEPLGYDWRIGIALLSSFAAREVFVSSMGIIFNLGEDVEGPETQAEADKHPLVTRLKQEYSIATAWSLLLFYVFAMQCMATLAVVKRETKSWKWPLVQLLFMTGLAYLVSFFTYQLLS